MKQADSVEGGVVEGVAGEAESRISRWSRRKQASRVVQDETDKLVATASMEPEAEEQSPPQLTDEDMPSLETLTGESDYTGFLSPKVSDELRKLALRKLFHGSQFNICDGLDDYDEDFTKFAKLGDVITAEMRQRAELEALRKLQQQEGMDPHVIEDASLSDGQESVDATIEGSGAFEEAASVDDQSETETEAGTKINTKA